MESADRFVAAVVETIIRSTINLDDGFATGCLAGWVACNCHRRVGGRTIKRAPNEMRAAAALLSTRTHLICS